MPQLRISSVGKRVSKLIEGLLERESRAVSGPLCDLASLERREESPKKGVHTLSG